MLDAEVPGHRQEQLMQNLIVRFVENTLLFVALKVGRARAPLVASEDANSVLTNLCSAAAIY